MFSYLDLTSSSVDSNSSALLFSSSPSSESSDVWSALIAGAVAVWLSSTTPSSVSVSRPNAETKSELKELRTLSTGTTESSLALTTLFSPCT